MSRNESPEWAKRDAKLYLHLAAHLGWTPEQITAIDPAIRFAMATDLGLVPADDEPAKQNPDADAANPEGLAEWERELLDRQENEAPLPARGGDIVVNLHLDGKQIHQAIVPYAERYRRDNGPGPSIV